MVNLKLDDILSSISSFEEFEQLKSNNEFCKSVANEIISRHKLSKKPLTIFADGTNIVFAYGKDQVIKIFPPFHAEQFKSERLVLKHLQDKLSVKTPNIQYDGEMMQWPYLVMTKLEGTLLETLWETMDYKNKEVIIHELGALIREVHSLPTQGLESIDCHWSSFINYQIGHCIAHHRSKGLADKLLDQLSTYLKSNKGLLQEIKNPVLLTGEYTPMNLLVKQHDGVWHIDGLIDFGDAMLGLQEYDLLGPGAFLIQGDKSLLRLFLTAYGFLPNEMTEILSYQLTALMLLHKYSNLNVQIRIKNWKEQVSSIEALQNLVWGLGGVPSQQV